LTDEQLEAGMTEQEAVKKGVIKRDTFWIIAKDTLFGKDFTSSDLRFVPGVNKADGTPLQFSMDTATLTSGSGYIIKVFEASVKYDDYLLNLNKQLLYNLDEVATKQNKFPGLRVGSLTEINNNSGNWENL
jgi:capsular polysaccharide biosynthesis protein